MDRDAVRQLAILCQLSLTETEAKRAEEQLGRLLEWFEQIREVDTDGVADSPYPRELPLKCRDDEPGAVLSHEDVVANAPAVRAGQFLVPRVVES